LQTLYGKENVIDQYRLPFYDDPDGDEVILSVSSDDLKNVPDFIIVMDRQISLLPKIGDSGTYNLTVILKDVNFSPLYDYYNLIVKIEPATNTSAPDVIEEEDDPEEVDYSQVDYDLEALILSIDQLGLAEIDFSEKMAIDLEVGDSRGLDL